MVAANNENVTKYTSWVFNINPAALGGRNGFRQDLMISRQLNLLAAVTPLSAEGGFHSAFPTDPARGLSAGAFDWRKSQWSKLQRVNKFRVVEPSPLARPSLPLGRRTT